MKIAKTIYTLSGALFVLCAVTGVTLAQWSQAVLERVTSGPENDHLGHSSLALDDQGTLHLLYDRWMGGADHDFYYKVKPLGGSWTYDVPIGDLSANLLSPCLAVAPQTGTAYAVFLQNGSLRLGVGNLEVWAYYDLPVPGAPPLFDPALAVDANGYAHVAFILQSSGVYRIGYGYWDGLTFHFQIIANSELGPFGSGAAPDICVTSDGGVAISYRGGTYLAYRIDVAENFSLGMTNWEIQTIYQPSYQCYETSIKAAADDNLYLAYSGDMGWGFPGHVFYAYKPDGAMQWGPSTEVSGSFSGVAPKLAMKVNGVAHILFEERSGNILTGNICYTTNLSGSWQAQYLLQGEKYNHSLVVDAFGNGSTCYEQYVGSNNQDIYYYGYVQSEQTLPDVTLTLRPINPPIIIPATGGSFDFTATVTNSETTPMTFQVWIMVGLPAGTWYGPVLGPITLNMPAGGTIVRLRTQNVQANAAPGDYTYRGYVGTYDTVKWDSSSFMFTKLATGHGDWIGDWNNSGQSFEQESSAAAQAPAEFALLSAYPNPFNPSTTIRFALPEAARVQLTVFNISGKVAAVLENGWLEAGSHEAIFDGAGLSSGVYFYRLQAGPCQASGKIALLR